MSQREYCVVIDQDGVRGVFDADQLAQPQILITSVDNKKAVIARDLLVQQEDGTYYLPLSLSQLEDQHLQQTRQFNPVADNVEAVLPVIVEEVNVQKQWVEKGRVQVRKVIREEEEIVSESLLKEEVEIEHVPVNRMIDQPVKSRYEGDTLIIPLIEEVLVVEKRYLLKEEVRVTKRQVETPMTQSVTVRKEEVVVQRVDNQGNSKPE